LNNTQGPPPLLASLNQIEMSESCITMILIFFLSEKLEFGKEKKMAGKKKTKWSLVI